MKNKCGWVLGWAGALLFPSVSFAQSVDFLGKLETKLNSIIDQLQGGLARVIITLAIIFFGLGMLSGRINKGVCMVIIGAGFVIMFAGEIASFFFE